MNAARTITLTTLAIVCMTFAHELCFEATTFGGWLPFLTLGLGPVLGFVLGAVRSDVERRAVRRWIILNCR
jgi:hypothetical protein